MADICIYKSKINVVRPKYTPSQNIDFNHQTIKSSIVRVSDIHDKR